MIDDTDATKGLIDKNELGRFALADSGETEDCWSRSHRVDLRPLPQVGL